MWNYDKGIDAKNKRISSHFYLVRCNEFKSLVSYIDRSVVTITPFFYQLVNTDWNLVGEIMLLLLIFSYHFNLVQHWHRGQTTLKQENLFQQISSLPFYYLVLLNYWGFSRQNIALFPPIYLESSLRNPTKNKKSRCGRPQHWALKLNENGLMFKLKLPFWIFLSGRSKLFAI